MRNAGYKTCKQQNRTWPSGFLTPKQMFFAASALRAIVASLEVIRHDDIRACQNTQCDGNWDPTLNRRTKRRHMDWSSSKAAGRAEHIFPIKQQCRPWEVYAPSSDTLSACHVHLLPFCRVPYPSIANLKILAQLEGPGVDIKGKQCMAGWSVTCEATWRESSAHRGVIC